MKTRILVGMYLLVVLVACNKESNVTNPVIEEPTYYPLTTGSYWIYNTYKIDSLKNEELISENDTTAIIGDTIINGHQYKVFYGKRYGHMEIKTEKYLRDSLGYIVNSNGKIVFCQTNFTDTLYSVAIPNSLDTLYYEFTEMQSVVEEIILPSGAFDSIINNQLKFVFWKVPNKPTFDLDNLYAPNVGKIISQYGYAGALLDQKSYYEHRLIDYFIAD